MIMNFFCIYFYSQIIQNSTKIFDNAQFTMHNAKLKNNYILPFKIRPKMEECSLFYSYLITNCQLSSEIVHYAL
jgi:hypothetical protein